MKKKGFTLVELLVVISIIALLMSILMPALSKARKQAQTVVCQSNLKQWGMIFYMYAEENNDHLLPNTAARQPNYGNDKDWGLSWINVLVQYYSNDKIRLCPSAKKLYSKSGFSPFSAWSVTITDKNHPLYGRDGKSSYGQNFWTGDPPNYPGGKDRGYFIKDHWKTINAKGAARVPLFLDCNWIGGWPLNFDTVPRISGEPPISGDCIGRFAMNRHGHGELNGVFLDSSVRKIGIKELWKLKWHRRFMTNMDMSSLWEPWMKSFREY